MTDKLNQHLLLGAIAGDVIGSVYEFNNIKTTNFRLITEASRFTDDTILTIAVADAILNGKPFDETIAKYARSYPNTYGPGFINWLKSKDLEPYNSFGNGSAMRVSPVGFAYNSIEEVMSKAQQSAEVTHNHPEGIKGAQSIACSIYLARKGKTKKEIKNFIASTFNYDLEFFLDDIRPNYKFDATCQGSVPQAIVAFLESTDYENAIRLAISIGGDSDTIACMTGGIASAFYQNIPKEINNKVLSLLPIEFIDIIEKFDNEFLR